MSDIAEAEEPEQTSEPRAVALPPSCSAFWRDMASAPKDDTEIIILFDSATVDIVRLCWWNDGIGCDFEPDPKARGWWSYMHSVTQELIDTRYKKPLGWMPHPDRPNASAEPRRP